MAQNVVIFDPAEFKEIYPQFENVSDTVCGFAFSQAELYLDNSVKSPVSNLEKRKILLYLLTCHILTLKERGDAVGSLSNATEGSVSVGYSVPNIAGAEFFSQTQCGMAFWQAIKPYKLGGLYFAKCC